MNFTDDQHDAITNPAARLCVDAGAGSGKTRVLVERVVYLVEKRSVPLEQIAAITFTEKAAAEMKARLRQAFRQRAQAAEDNPDRMTQWRELEHRVDTARISTIHAFCAGFLREYALQIGLDPDFSVLGEAETALMLSDSVRGAVIALLEAKNEAAILLTAEYSPKGLRDVLEAMLRQTPVVRAAAARQDFSDPEALYVSWESILKAERAAALETMARGRAVRGFVAELERFEGKCTKESDGREVLRRAMLSHLRELRDAKTCREIELHLSALTDKVGASRKNNWETEEIYEALKRIQEAIKKFAQKALDWPVLDPELDRAAARVSCALHEVFEHATQAWETAKRAANSMDFDGLIQETLRVLQENAVVRERAARGLRHLLMDEFQDTDRIQLAIAEQLCSIDGGPDFFFVGDPKQSIYNFRGAEVELFAEERTKAEKPIPLRENFRTLPPLIAFINGFFATSSLLHAVGDYAAMGAGRQPEEEDPHAGPRIEFLAVRGLDDDGAKRNVEATRRAEAEMIAARIQSLCAVGAPPLVHDESSGGWRVPRFGDIALLFRSTGSLYIYEEALRAAGIDFIATAGSGFHRRQEILDVVNVLRVVVGPRDAAALAAFLRSPLGRMSDDGLLLLANEGGLLRAFARESSPASLAAGDAEALAAARALIVDLREKRHWPPSELLAYLYEHSGIEAIVLDHHYGLQKASNLRKFAALALEFSAHTRAPLDRFVRYLAEVAEHEALREGEALMQPFGGGAVTLMTVHKSKGLEFPIVFVCDMGQGQKDSHEHTLFLHRDLGFVLRGFAADGASARPALAHAINVRAAAKNEAESARLLYVAMTRARDYLVLCGKEEPGTGSWFESLDHGLAFLPPRDGHVLKGTGWSARVTVKAAPLPRSMRDDVGLDVSAVEDALRRIGLPLPVAEVPLSLSISALLDRMGSSLDDEEDDSPSAEDRAPIHNTAALRRGSIVHRLFELWDFARAEAPVDAALDGASFGPTERAALAEDLARTAERFLAMPIFATLANATNLKRELPFVLRLGETIVHGTIDALIAPHTIIDYKTGRFDPEKHARYETQLRLYAIALQRLAKTPPTSALLLYIDAVREEAVSLSPADLAVTLARAEAALMKSGAPS